MSTDQDTTNKMAHWKILWNLSNAGPIIRRYFVMNFFDGVLTALGIVLGFFTTYLKFISTGTDSPNRTLLVSSAFFTAIAIGVSGLTGSHLAESAERRLNVLEMKQVLGLMDQDGKEKSEEDENVPKWLEADLKLALGNFEQKKAPVNKGRMPKSALLSLQMGLSDNIVKKLEKNNSVEPMNGQSLEKLNLKPNKKQRVENQSKRKLFGRKKEEKEETIFEEAQEFASRVAAVIDGFSPFAGVVIVIIPFLFGNDNSIPGGAFIASFILTGVVLFLLGTYLAKMSKDSIIKYGTQMVLAAVITSALSLFLNELLPST